jgi:hypothetical protein
MSSQVRITLNFEGRWIVGSINLCGFGTGSVLARIIPFPAKKANRNLPRLAAPKWNEGGMDADEHG